MSVFFSCKIDTIVVLYLKKFLFMKQLIPLSIALILMASGCATYDITVYGPDGAVHAEHTTDELYVGTDAFVLDAIIDPFVMVYSLFQPVPMLSSSMGIYGGMQLGSYISKMASLAPVSLIGGGSGSGITFDADDGMRYSYEGFEYSLTRQSKAEMKTREEIKAQVDEGRKQLKEDISQ